MIFKDINELLTETSSCGCTEGSIWNTNKEGYSYTEASPTSTDYHVITTGGTKLYVNPINNTYDVKAFGAIGDGIANDTLAFNKAMDILSKQTFPKRLVASGRFVINLETVWNITDNTTLDWSNATFIPASTNNTKTHITIMGHRNGESDKAGVVWPPVIKTSLTKDALRWDTSIEVADASGIQEGDLLVLISKEYFQKKTQTRDTQEATRVSSVVGNKIYLDAPILCDYTASGHQADGGTGYPDVCHFSTAQKVEIIGGIFEIYNRVSKAIVISDINLPKLSGQRFIQPYRRGLEIRNCSGDTHYDQVLERMGEEPTDDSETYPSFGYGVMHTSCCYSRVFAGQGRRGWHSYDATAGQRDITYYNFIGQMEQQSISSHADCVLFRVVGCQIDSRYAIHGRGRYIQVEDCKITTVTAGNGVEWGGESWELHITGCEFDGTYDNAYAINSRAWVRSDNQIHRDNSRVFIIGNKFLGRGTNISVEKGAHQVVFEGNTIVCDDYATTPSKIVLDVLDDGEGVFSNNVITSPSGGGRACISLGGDSDSKWTTGGNIVSGWVSHDTSGYIYSLRGDGCTFTIAHNTVDVDKLTAFISTASAISLNIVKNSITADENAYLIRQTGSKSSTINRLVHNDASFPSTRKSLVLAGSSITITQEAGNVFSDT